MVSIVLFFTTSHEMADSIVSVVLKFDDLLQTKAMIDKCAMILVTFALS